MNYYDPFMFSNPMMYSTTAIPKVGLIRRLFGNGINFSSILTGTQKTLNVVNQAIPLIQQAKPIVSNARTMFKVMNEFKRVDSKDSRPVVNRRNINNTNTNTNINRQEKEPTNSYEVEAGPMFFQ